MTTSIAPQARTGQTVELGRYVTDHHERRVLLGKRIACEVRVYDAPIGEASEGIYLVDQGFETRSELAMMVRDYLRQASELGCCPMGPLAIQGMLV